MCGPSSVASKYAWYLYVYMSVFLRICLLISAHMLVLSARIQVCICRYPSPYLQVSTFVSKRIHLSICSPSASQANQIITHTRARAHPPTFTVLPFLTPALTHSSLASAALATASAGVTARLCLQLLQIPQEVLCAFEELEHKLPI